MTDAIAARPFDSFSEAYDAMKGGLERIKARSTVLGTVPHGRVELRRIRSALDDNPDDGGTLKDAAELLFALFDSSADQDGLIRCKALTLKPRRGYAGGS